MKILDNLDSYGDKLYQNIRKEKEDGSYDWRRVQRKRKENQIDMMEG